MLLKISIVAATFFLSSCKSRSFQVESEEKGLADGMIYQPSRELASSPKDIGLDFSSFFIDSGVNGKLHSWLVKSTCQKTKGIVVYFHGTGNNIAGEFKYVAWLPNACYDVLTFDYRGYGLSSDKKPTPEKTIEDGIAALRYTKKLNYENVFIVGQSLGGAIAYTSAAQAMDVPINKLVLDSTFGSYRRMANAMFQNVSNAPKPVAPGAGWLFSRFITERFSPNLFLNRTALPVLTFHGDADEVIPISEGQTFFNEIKNTSKKFVVVTGGKHVRTFIDFGRTYQDMVTDFFEK